MKVTALSNLRGREDVAVMPGIGKPLDDRSQALRHSGDRIADAVIVHEKEAHD